MPLAKFRANAFGVTVISLVVLFDVLAIRCIYQVAYLRVRILQQNFLQLDYFNGSWVTCIFLILVAILWSLSEIARLGFLKGSLFSSITWQRNMCKLYILFNLGFSEPSIFLILVFLLRASLLKRELGALNQGWNKRAIGHVFLFCLPISIMQFIVVFVGPKLFDKEKGDGRANKANYFVKAGVLIRDECVCTYPLFSTILLGIFHAALISYALFIGMHVLSSAINKRLLRGGSICWYPQLFFLFQLGCCFSVSVIFSLPVRVLLLSFSYFFSSS